MVYVTDHAAKRTKQRAGLPKALQNGIRHEETKGALRRYLDSVYLKRETANNIRIYCNNVYLFHNEMLITLYPLPPEFRRIATKLWKELRKND